MNNNLHLYPYEGPLPEQAPQVAEDNSVQRIQSAIEVTLSTAALVGAQVLPSFSQALPQTTAAISPLLTQVKEELIRHAGDPVKQISEEEAETLWEHPHMQDHQQWATSELPALLRAPLGEAELAEMRAMHASLPPANRKPLNEEGADKFAYWSIKLQVLLADLRDVARYEQDGYPAAVKALISLSNERIEKSLIDGVFGFPGIKTVLDSIRNNELYEGFFTIPTVREHWEQLENSLNMLIKEGLNKYCKMGFLGGYLTEDFFTDLNKIITALDHFSSILQEISEKKIPLTAKNIERLLSF